MEEKRHPDPDPTFENLLEASQKGDKAAMEKLLEFFAEEIEYLACFIKMPREDAMQTIKLEFLERIRKGEIDGKASSYVESD